MKSLRWWQRVPPAGTERRRQLLRDVGVLRLVREVRPLHRPVAAVGQAARGRVDLVVVLVQLRPDDVVPACEVLLDGWFVILWEKLNVFLLASLSGGKPSNIRL